jgi:large subunit ribosomal protein L35Ae
MRVKLVGFRCARREAYNDYGILSVQEENPAALIGQRVIWKTPTGKGIPGKIIRLHGKSGTLLARFEKGLPGYAIGSELIIPRLEALKKAEESKAKAKEKKPTAKKAKKKKVKKEPAKKKPAKKEKESEKTRKSEKRRKVKSEERGKQKRKPTKSKKK